MRKLLKVRDTLLETGDEDIALKEIKKIVETDGVSHYQEIEMLFNDKKIQEWNEFTYWENKISKYRDSKNKNAKTILQNLASGMVLIKAFDGAYEEVKSNALIKALKEHFGEEEFVIIKNEAFKDEEEIIYSSLSYDKKESYLSEEEHVSEMIKYYKEKIEGSLYEKELNSLIEKIKTIVQEKK